MASPTEDKRAKNVLVYSQIVLAIVAILACVSTFWVYKYRVDRLEVKADAFEAHIHDKSIHVTEDQMKNLIEQQLHPVIVSLKQMETSMGLQIPAQQKQLDRIERMMEDFAAGRRGPTATKHEANVSR
jgi:hypothetical protein